MECHDRERAARTDRTRVGAHLRGFGALLLALLFLVGVGLASSARAQAPSTAHKLNAIRERMETGQALFQSDKLEAAAQVFDDSYSKYPYSAFLFNAGVCYQRLERFDDALARFRRYLSVDPEAPDVGMVRERIGALERLVAARASSAADAGPSQPVDPSDGGDAGLADAAEFVEGGSPEDAAGAGAAVNLAPQSMKSLVLIETEPPGAPLELWAPTSETSTPYVVGGTNPEWRVIVRTQAPASLTLDVGQYHVVVNKHRDYNQTERDILVSAGKVLHFMANLSQGEFMAFLRVSASVPGATVYLDDPDRLRPPWGVTPHAELVPPGEHDVLVLARGYSPFRRRVRLEQGEQEELNASLERVPFGVLRVDATAPQVEVEVDGRPVGTWRDGTPPLELELTAGAHALTVTSKGRKPFHGRIEVPKGRILPVHVRMIRTYPRGPAWTQAVIGGVMIGASTYLGLESNRLHRELRADRRAGVLTDDDPRLLRGKLYAISADVGLGVAGMLTLLAAHGFIKDPLPDSSKHEGGAVEFGTPNESDVTPPPESAGAGRRALIGLVPAPSLSGGVLVLGRQF